MKQIKMSLAVILTVFAGPCSAYDSGTKPHVVYAIKDIKAGSVFTNANVRTKTIAPAQVPKDAVTSVEALFERRCRDTIAKGRSIRVGDITPDDLLKWTKRDELFERRLKSKHPKAGQGVALYLIRDVPPGVCLDGFCMGITERELNRIPIGAAQSYKQIFGCVAKDGIAHDEILLDSHVLPAGTPVAKSRKFDVSSQSLYGTSEPTFQQAFHCFHRRSIYLRSLSLCLTSIPLSDNPSKV